jgi:hypothetical protein
LFLLGDNNDDGNGCCIEGFNDDVLKGDTVDKNGVGDVMEKSGEDGESCTGSEIKSLDCNEFDF